MKLQKKRQKCRMHSCRNRISTKLRTYEAKDSAELSTSNQLMALVSLHIINLPYAIFTQLLRYFIFPKQVTPAQAHRFPFPYHTRHDETQRHGSTVSYYSHHKNDKITSNL